MTKTISLIVAGLAATALTVGPALAGKVTAYDGRKEITVDGKKYSISGSSTAVTIAGKKAEREAIKVGMDCALKGPADRPTNIDCK